MNHLVAALGAALLCSACYTYRMTAWDTAPVGEQVRGLLSTEARIRLEDSLRLRVDRLEGGLVERNADRALFEVRTTQDEYGRPLYQRIELAQKDVLRMEVRRLDRLRTAALAAGVAAVTVAVIVFRASNNPGEPNGGPPLPPDAPPVWLFRIPLPR